MTYVFFFPNSRSLLIADVWLFSLGTVLFTYSRHVLVKHSSKDVELHFNRVQYFASNFKSRANFDNILLVRVATNINDSVNKDILNRLC